MSFQLCGLEEDSCSTVASLQQALVCLAVELSIYLARVISQPVLEAESLLFDWVI